MKKAVILEGSHWSGKSSAINEFLKPMLKSADGKTMGPAEHKFILNDQEGYILSESFEEALKEFPDFSEKYFGHDLLVFANRPETKESSKLNSVREALEKAGYTVTVITINGGDEKQRKAREIFDVLNSKMESMAL